MDVTSNEARDAAAPKDAAPESETVQGVPPASSTVHDSEVVDDSVLADPKFAACLERLEGHWPKPKLKTPPHTFQRLGRFEIRRELGRGRFGVVFLAWDPQLQRQVALKVPQFDAAMDPDLRERFRGEALSAGQLQHSGIVSIYDVGQHAGVDYLAMAYVEGMTLAERLQAGPLPPAEAVYLLRQLARAVHHAHQQGVIHRDLKPSNVLLDQAGEPHVTDFGLARRLSDSAMRATHTGQVLGTPAYMSPEQAAGHSDIGPASDVYALGVILYETITGRPPFQAATFVEAVEFILKRDPLPPSKLNPKLPRELDAITFKCLEKRAPARYASAAELADDLQCYLEGKPIRARTLGPVQRVLRWARKYPSQALLVVAAVVLMGLLLSVGVVYDRWQHADALAAEQRTSAETERYFATVNQARNVISRRQPGWSKRAQVELQKAAAMKLPVADRSELRQLATECLTGFDLQKDVTIATGLLIGRIAASPDGSLLAVGELKGNASCRVVVYDTATRQPLHTFTILNEGWKRVLTGQAKWQDGVREFAFSSDNRYLAVGMRFGSVYVYDLQSPGTTPRHLVVSNERELDHMAFSRDGQTLFAQTKDYEFIRWLDWRKEVTPDSPFPDKSRSFVTPPFGNALYLVNHQRDSFRMLNQNLQARTYYSPFAKLQQTSLVLLATDGDGSLVAGTTEHGLSVYETLGGVLVGNLQDDTVGTESLADELTLSRDGQLLMAFEDRGVVRLFDVARSRQVMRLPLPRHDFQDVALDPERRWLAVANDKSLEFWRLTNGPIRRVLLSPAEAVEDMAFSPAGDSLACVTTAGVRLSPHRTTLFTVASETGLIRAQRSMGWEHLAFSAELAQVAWQSPESILVNSTSGSTVWANNTTSGELGTQGFVALTGPMIAVDFEVRVPGQASKRPARFSQIPHPQNPTRTVLQVDPRAQPIVLKCRCDEPANAANQLACLVISLKIDADPSFAAPLGLQTKRTGEHVHSAPPWTWMGTQGNFQQWSVWLPEVSSEFELTLNPTSAVRSFQIERIDVVALDLPAGQLASKFTAVQQIEMLSLPPNGKRIWGCVAEEVNSWSWPDGKKLSTWKNPHHRVTGAGNIRALQAGRQGTLVGTRDGRAHWLDPARGTSLGSWSGAGEEVVAVALCEEAQLALVGSENGKVRGLTVPQGEVQFDLAADDAAILALAATPDGQTLVTASANRTLKLWKRTADHSGYTLFCALPETVGLTKKLALSADGKHLAVLGRLTASVELWNLPKLQAELQRVGIE